MAIRTRTNLRLQVDGEESVAGGGDDEGGEAEPDPGDLEHVAHGDLLVRPLAALQRRLADLALRQEGDAQQRHANLRQEDFYALYFKLAVRGLRSKAGQIGQDGEFSSCCTADSHNYVG